MSKQGENSKPNVIHRVIRQDSSFICGLCNTRYADERQAEACLARCTQERLADDHIEANGNKKQARYRCTYCKRIYGSVEQAKECVRKCKDDLQKKIQAETQHRHGSSYEAKLKALAAYASEHDFSALPERLASLGRNTARKLLHRASDHVDQTGSDESPDESFAPPSVELPAGIARTATVHAAEGTKFSRAGERFQCLICHQKYQSYQEAMKCYDMHDPPAAKPSEVGAGVKRNGAKYQCQVCKKTYFTRQEATSCYESHSDSQLEVAAPNPKAAAARSQQKPEGSTEATRSSAANETDKFFRDGARYVCRLCNKKHFTKVDVLACYDSHDSSSELDPWAPPPVDAVAATIESTLKDLRPTGTKNRDDEGKFYRNGARYICKKCGAKFFTRAEVVACFDGHR